MSVSFWRALHAKTIEPQQRLVGGSYGWVRHRFPIKDGISERDAMIRDMCRPNPIYEAMFASLMSKQPNA